MDSQKLSHNEHLVMFVQEILCWRRPILTLILGLTLHVVWFFVAFSEQRPAAVLFTFLIAALAVDAVLRVVLPRVSWGSHLPALLPAGSPHRLMLPLRTYAEVCASAENVRAAWADSVAQYMAMRNREFGKATILAVCVCLLLALITNFLSGAFLSYILVLTVLLVPPLERVPFLQARASKARHYLAVVGNIVLRITSLVSENLSLEPVTAEEMQALEDEEERVLAEAMKRRVRDGMSDDEDDFRPKPKAVAPASRTTTSSASSSATASRTTSTTASASASASALGRVSSADLSEDGFEMISADELLQTK